MGGHGMFWRLLIGNVFMLSLGHFGEKAIINPRVGFACGMAGWGFILFEIFAGEGGQVAGKDAGEYVGSAFNLMRFIVSIGWSIYPLGYFFGYLMGSVDENVLNFVYNFADMLNKIWFRRHLGCSQGRDRGQGQGIFAAMIDAKILC